MKIINDILKINGKYSLKRVITIVTFIYILMLASYIVAVKGINILDIFNSFMLFLGALLGIVEITKKFLNKAEDKKDE